MSNIAKIIRYTLVFAYGLFNLKVMWFLFPWRDWTANVHGLDQVCFTSLTDCWTKKCVLSFMMSHMLLWLIPSHFYLQGSEGVSMTIPAIFLNAIHTFSAFWKSFVLYSIQRKAHTLMSGEAAFICSSNNKQIKQKTMKNPVYTIWMTSSLFFCFQVFHFWHLQWFFSFLSCPLPTLSKRPSQPSD